MRRSPLLILALIAAAAAPVFFFVQACAQSPGAPIPPGRTGRPLPPRQNRHDKRPGVATDGNYSEPRNGPEVFQVPESEKLKDFTFIDVHAHITNRDQDMNVINEFMADNHVEKMVILGMNIKGSNYLIDAATLNAVSKSGGKLIAMTYLAEPDGVDAPEFVRNNMATGKFAGLGELFINGHGETHKGDSATLDAVYKAVGEYNGIVSTHWTIGSDSINEPGTEDKLAELDNALGNNPDTVFILNHFGAGPPPQKPDFKQMITTLLDNHANLYLDIGGMHINYYDGRGNITETGKIILEIIKKYPGRVMSGFDMKGDDYADKARAANVVNLYRRYLGNLPDDIARKVAHDNAAKLFNMQQAEPSDDEVKPVLNKMQR